MKNEKETVVESNMPGYTYIHQWHGQMDYAAQQISTIASK
jgi:cbb3-type cytochrome oxidase cytochrome c subunit